MTQRLISRILPKIAPIIFMAHNSALFADHIYSEVETDIKDESNYFHKKILVVQDTESGREYRSGPIQGRIYLTEDFDGDGKQEALLIYNKCPGSRCLDYYRIAALKDGKIIVADPKPEITNPEMEQDGKRLLLVEQEIDHKLYYAFDGHEISVTKRIVSPKTLKDIRTHVYSYIDDQRYEILAFDLNGDGHKERIACEKDWSWGYYSSCELPLPDGKTQSFFGLCRRVGILPHISNGYHDLICDFDTVLIFNGSEWIDPEESQGRSD
ncbi:hypothetical protein ThidrDRAFT_0249 [Thiorhodococcus drewsii AZ1]|uniref:Uncharacterized protein n=1 Tax=Thiorhodococcus drewsii AZ1 TaxID=765913 RepID=G2DVS9_9GAMM|nr:hypothetical protein [Thiorhodococcus drewsii]EGV34094.1 hypothetical protein ThidrDRAFT_0249 [Thiorhodococcus drewsii AZ1]